MPTTPASSAQSTLNPRIRRPRIFRLRNAIANSPFDANQRRRVSDNHEQGDNRRAVLVRNSVPKNLNVPAKQRGYDRYVALAVRRAKRGRAAAFDHANPNRTPARARPPAIPIGVPSARQQAAPDIVPSP